MQKPPSYHSMFIMLFICAHTYLFAQNQNKAVIINNARIFNGKSDRTTTGNLLIENNVIRKISTQPVTASAGYEVTTVDAGGRFLMPGLIDMHYHAMFAAFPERLALVADVGLANIIAARNSEALLMQGVTTIRDMGGPTFGLKRAIDMGVAKGPRIFPSGAFISQTGGHGDFRLPTEIPADPSTGLSFTERTGVAAIADDPGAVRKKAREQLMLGASQLKLMAGGGVSSHYDPLDVTQYTREEIRAAVEAAENWGTYVTVHVYTPRAAIIAIDAGVKCIEHGQLLDEATVKIMAEKKIWWSLQPFLSDEDANPKAEADSRQKQMEVATGTQRAYELARKYKIRTAWGTDVMYSAELAGREGKQLAKLVRWYSPFEVLKMATADNAELLALSGKRSPYAGRLGVIEEGALADILILDGDPLQDINVIADPKNLMLIMKDGAIYKKSLVLSP